MTKKKVWRYYCDFCRRGGCSSGHMKKHEKRCTKNPHRECGMCLGGDPTSTILALKLVGIVPPPSPGPSDDGDGAPLMDDVTLAKVKESCDGCPACMLAIIRQLNWFPESWRYEAEAKEYLNEKRQEESDLLH